MASRKVQTEGRSTISPLVVHQYPNRAQRRHALSGRYRNGELVGRPIFVPARWQATERNGIHTPRFAQSKEV